MKPHFFMSISANERMEFQTELFIKSLEYFGKCTDYFLDIFILEGEFIKSNFIKSKATINYFKPSSTIDFHFPWGCQPRYSLDPKSEICIHVDADIFVLSNFDKLINYCIEPGFYGSIANDPPFSLTHWRKIFKTFNMDFPTKFYLYKKNCGDFQQSKEFSVCPFYPNNGLLVMHSKYVKSIRSTINEVLFELNKEYRDNYYITQVAIAITLQLEKIPVFLLPNEFNFITSYKYKVPLCGTENPAICHYNYKTLSVKDLYYHKQTYESAKTMLNSFIKFL